MEKLTEVHQAVYNHGLAGAQDAQFELTDASPLSPSAHFFPNMQPWRTGKKIKSG